MLLATLANDQGCAADRKPHLAREKLRQATAQAHRELDAQLSGFDLNCPSGYRRFLEANAAALLPLEDALERSGVADIFCDWHERSRRSAILADLERLDGVMRLLPAIEPMSRKRMFGALYVLEGSRLGASFLLRSIESCGEPLIAASTAYLRHGAGKSLWRSFLLRLEGEPIAAADEADMVLGAHHTFAMFAEAAARA